ncbi:hypothetical protein [Vibrio aestuarianus]|uniref:hypothetical protein n=1 Tax=Vibrio aestuarianus TaxID=28171 RepID=UPI00237C75C9|nr:hypothetical protein [Vibrio aestuarianus]MDE1328512.1 hypothetical protein [Vibrio aestuarianus]
MAVTVEATKVELIKELEARGFITKGDHQMNDAFMEAIAAAMKTVINRDAKANVTSGSSAGQWSIL